jgi:hypothetical protein
MINLRDEFDNNDQSDAIERGVIETDVGLDPMVTTSIRLPKSLLDWVRVQAAAENLKATALIRKWIEEQRHNNGCPGSVDARLQRLEEIVSAVLYTPPPPQRQSSPDVGAFPRQGPTST